MTNRSVAAAFALVFLLIAILRILHADRTVPQGADEAAHVAAGIQWLDKHSYTLDPVHPPLAEYAIALPLYLVGEHLPSFSACDPRNASLDDLGNAILYEHGHYMRNLFLARMGIISFFCLTALILFLWTVRYFGDFAACLAVGLFTTIPGALAFSSYAYNDLPAAAMQFAALWIFVLWLENPTRPLTILLGISSGLAFATKFTSLVFLPPCAGAIFVAKLWVERHETKQEKKNVPKQIAGLALAAIISVVALWSTYGFSTGRVREAMGLSVSAIPLFQHFPAPIRKVAREAVLSDPAIPAPELIHGLAMLWAANGDGPDSYLFGEIRKGGRWYFFPVAEGLKTPLPLLILGLCGIFYAVRSALRGDWRPLAPAGAIAALFLITALARYKTGTRYILLFLPLMCVLAGYAGSRLWWLAKPKLVVGRILLILILSWEVLSTIQAQSDFLAYFNELAPRDPSAALVGGCDLDCGQDVFNLARALQARGASHVTLALWSYSDLSHMGLPPYDVLEPFHPVTGWIAISARSRRMGDVLHKTYPAGAFAWLSAYRPVANVGKTILLYHISDRTTQSSISHSPASITP